MSFKIFLHSECLGVSLRQSGTYVTIGLLNLEKETEKFKLQKECFNLSYYLNFSYSRHAGYFSYSRGTKVEKMVTLAPERYTAGFCIVAKVILWCI